MNNLSSTNTLKDILESQIDEYKRLETLSQNLEIEGIENIITKNDEIDSLIKNEMILDKMNDFIRNKWLEKCFYHSYKHYKSPIKHWHETTIGTPIFFDYERTLKCNNLEDNNYNPISNYVGFTSLYNSAMSAILNSILILNTFLVQNKNYTLDSYFVGYYETISLLTKFSREFNINNQLIDYNAVFFLIEPIKANLRLDIIYLEELIDRILDENKNQIIFMIIDHSLMGTSFNKEKLMDRDISKRIIFVFIRSLLKLDQQGLELSNCGISQWYFPEKMKDASIIIRKKLEISRDYTGSNLSFYELNTIDAIPFLKDTTYSNRILNNTKLFISKIDEIPINSIIKEINYPEQVNYQDDYYLIPFIIIRLKDENEEDYFKLEKYFSRELENINLKKDLRCSFGFRNISYHLIKYKSDINRYAFRIAPGNFRGIKYYLFIQLLNNIINMSSDTFKEIGVS